MRCPVRPPGSACSTTWCWRFARCWPKGLERVAYVDIDVHHGDGVQAAFYDDPRVLTISVHQDPRTLYPGHRHAERDRRRRRRVGTSINLPVPPGTADDGWLRAFDAVVPSAVTAFRPDVLVTQCGCDTHHEDPLADLALTVDGQRAAYAELHELAHAVAGGRWLALGGGGYGVLRCVPRAWTHLLAETTGRADRARTEIPQHWSDDVRGSRRHRAVAAAGWARAVIPRRSRGSGRRELAGPLDRGHPQGQLPAAGPGPDDPRD